MAGFFFPGADKIIQGVLGGSPLRIPPTQNRPPLFGGIFDIFQNADNERQEREEAEERRREESARRNESLHEQIFVERQNVEQMKRHMAKMKRKAHKEALKHEKRREKTLARLAHRTAMTKMQGNHIGVFGLTSTGKSTMINSLLGKKAADIGVGETTKQKTSYQGRNCIYWDTPGRNDESTYTNEEYISFIKGLTRRLIIVQYTIKENLKLIRLLDNLGLGYDIIVNKFDDVDQNEQSKFKQQIKDEINSFGLERMKKVFFLSAQYPKMFADWLTMVNYLSEPSTDYDRYSDTESSDLSDSSSSDSD